VNLQVPDFDLLQPIGQGGFGQVWQALNRTTGQPRAVKMIPLDRSNNRDPAGREIASLSRLEANVRCRHPNLLVIHHVGQTADHLFYVMDLADDLSGRSDLASPEYRPATLESRLAAAPLSADECDRCARQLLEALSCLHEAGMVHRDVKPANCLFLGGELKLGDFGLLTAANLPASRLGTLRYMPPDGGMDARADVYAAGLVIYEMLTGQSAERFPGLGDRARQIAEHPQLTRLNQLALRACEIDPSRRYCDARQMLAELTLGEKPRAGPRRFWRRASAACIMIAAVAALAFWMRPTPPVAVNFVTDPYEAMIFLDGQPQRAADGIFCRTPCTIRNLPTRKVHVVFQWDGVKDKCDAGEVDLAENREIKALFKAEN
jgi:serine/threonine protein kinase